MIRIRQAIYEDIPKIMKFIDEHWKKAELDCKSIQKRNERSVSIKFIRTLAHPFYLRNRRELQETRRNDKRSNY